MSKICYNCQRELQDADMFCDNCGARQNLHIAEPAVEVPPTEPTVDATPAEPATVPTPATPQKKTNALVWVLVSVLLLLLILGIFVARPLIEGYVNPLSKLPKVDKAEQVLKTAYTDIWEEHTGYSVGDIAYETETAAGGDFDEAFSCNVSPMGEGGPSMQVMGMAMDGRLVQVTSQVAFTEEEWKEATVGKNLMKLAALPATLYRRDIDSFNALSDFVAELEPVEGMDNAYCIEQSGLEYSLQVIVEDGYVMSVFCARYLPVFDSGFFEDAQREGYLEFPEDIANAMVLERFIKDVDGVWVDLSSCDDYGYGETEVMFHFCSMEGGRMRFGDYPGETYGGGKITAVEAEGNGIYSVTVYYEGEWYGGDYYPESVDTYRLQLKNNTLVFDSSSTHYTRMGNDFEATKKAVNKKWEEDHYVPELSNDVFAGIVASHLGVPQRTTITYKLYDKTHWDGADRDMRRVDFYEQGELVASAYACPYTGELLRSIWMYDPSIAGIY